MAYDSWNNAQMSRDERLTSLLQALDPTSIGVDERSLLDRLDFAARYGELINFYDKNNNRAGNWSGFFLKEPVILLATISKTEYQSQHQLFLLLEQRQNKITQAKQQGLVIDETAAINPLLELILSLFVGINGWLTSMNQYTSSYQIKTFVSQTVSGALSRNLWFFVSLWQTLSLGYKRPGPSISPPDLQTVDDFHPLWKKQYGNNDIAPDLSLEAAWPLVKQLYTRLFDFYVQVIDSAREEALQLLQGRCAYPDTALYIAFAKLMEIQQQQLNGITEKHLDFYYQQLLLQQPAAAVADQAYLSLRLAAGIDNFTLPAGTQFSAGSYADKTPIVFVANNAQSLNSVVPKSAQSLFYQPPVKSPQSQAGALLLQAAPQPGVVSKDTSGSILSWYPFGQAQPIQTEAIKTEAIKTQTINPAQSTTPPVVLQQGFTLASPLLYLPSGQRHIHLLFTFSETISAEYFADSTLFLSSASGWVQVTRSQETNTQETSAQETTAQETNAADSQPPPVVNLDETDNDKQVHLAIDLADTVPAIVPFPAATSESLAGMVSQWPLFRLVLSPSIDLTQVPQLVSVRILVEVENIQTLSLHNDDGMLAVGKPFMPLGSIPVPGSNFYIGAQEWLAKPLQQLQISFNWSDLPTDFSSYYQAYNSYLGSIAVPPVDQLDTFNNQAFQVQFANRQTNQWHMLKTRLQTTSPYAQQVGLFDEQSETVSQTTNKKGLFRRNKSSTTEVTKIVLQPSSCYDFDPEDLQTMTPDPTLLISGGADFSPNQPGNLRCQFNAPAEGFGHSLYGKVIAQVTLENAQILIKEASAATVVQLVTTLLSAIFKAIKVVVESLIKTLMKSVQAIGKLIKTLWGAITGKGVLPPTNTLATPPPASSGTLKPLPNLPYSLKSTSVTVTYHASSTTTFTASPTGYSQPDYPFEFYHDNGFKTYQRYPVDATSGGQAMPGNGVSDLVTQTIVIAEQSSYLPLFSGVLAQGTLYLQLDQLPSSANELSVFLQLSEQAVTASQTLPQVNYWYLSATGWQPLTLLQDGTNNWCCSGILVLDWPTDMVADSVAMSAGYWLAMTVSDNAPLFAKVAYMNTQAIQVTRLDPQAVPSGDIPQLAAGLITAPVTAIPQLAGLIQPFASFGGRAAQQQTAFYQSTSQRIGNKDRGVSSWDYEQMALAASTELYYVKCLPQSSSGQSQAAGVVQLGLVRAYNSVTLPGALRPVMGACERLQVQQAISKKLSPFVKLQLFNLQHQLVTIVARLTFTEPGSNNALCAQVSQQLVLFLSPWIQTDQAQIDIDSGLSYAQVMDFLTSIAGVSAVTLLQLITSEENVTPDDSANSQDGQNAPQEISKTVDVIYPPVNGVFVSALQHDIGATGVATGKETQPVAETV